MNKSTSAVILMLRQQVLSPVSGRPPKLPGPGDTPLCYGGGSTSEVSHTCSENDAKSADQLQHQNQLTSSNTKISWPAPTPKSADQFQHSNQLTSFNTKISRPVPTPESADQLQHQNHLTSSNTKISWTGPKPVTVVTTWWWIQSASHFVSYMCMYPNEQLDIQWISLLTHCTISNFVLC